MKKLNQNGFMMAEVIIVATIILGTLVGLYSIFNKMYVVYTQRSYYYNVDAVYALRTIYKKLIDNEKMITLINEGLGGNDYYLLIENNDSNINECMGYLQDEICSSLIDTYGITKVLFVKYDQINFDNLSSVGASSYSSSMKGYLNYLDSSMDFSDSNFGYIFIVELADGDYRYYGNYRIR